MVEYKGRAGQIAMQREEWRDRPRSAAESSERDMRDKGSRFWGNADAHEQLIDLAMQGCKLSQWLDPRPHHMRPFAPFKQIDPRNTRTNRRGVQRAERGGNILGAVMIDLADKAQRQVELLVILPSRARNAVHCGNQRDADSMRRAQRDEQAVGRHGGGNIGVLRIG